MIAIINTTRKILFVTKMMNAKNWYQQTSDKLDEIFGPDADLIAALFSATSPQVQLETSYSWTIQIYNQYRRGESPDLSMLHRIHRKNVLRALAGERLSGRKVRAFYRALRGDLSAVVLDTWMLKMFNWTKHNPEGRKYDKMARCFANVARMNGYEPAEFQAILWTDIRAKAGHKPISYLDCLSNDKQMELFPDEAPF